MQAALLMLALGDIYTGAAGHLLLQKLPAPLRLGFRGRRQRAAPALQRPAQSCRWRAPGPWADQRAAFHMKHMRGTVVTDPCYPADQGDQAICRKQAICKPDKLMLPGQHQGRYEMQACTQP